MTAILSMPAALILICYVDLVQGRAFKILHTVYVQSLLAIHSAANHSAALSASGHTLAAGTKHM